MSLELALVSRIFSLAMELGETDLNPCSRVRKLKLDNQRYRYLLPEEEPLLKEALTGQREHLLDLVSIAIGTGLRKNEQLSLKVEQLDFARNVIIATLTKAGKNREIPMNSEVRGYSCDWLVTNVPEITCLLVRKPALGSKTSNTRFRKRVN